MTEYYSDANYGGKRKALRVAKDRYDELVAVWGPPQNATKNLLTSRNTTGKVGVHLAYTQDNRYPGCEYYAYCASWRTEEGVRRKISFAVNRYGEDEAWELACIARDREIHQRDQVIAIRERQLKRKQGAGRAKSKSKRG